MPRRSNDKAARSPIEGLLYAPSCVSPGDEIAYSHLERRAQDVAYHRAGCTCDGRAIPCTVITAAECGDYSGNGLVGESNYRTLKEEFPWLVELYGSHGYKSLAYLGKRENQSDALIEAIDSLSEYPVYSDDDHSELEMERENEEWTEHGADDFRKALQDIFDLNDTRVTGNAGFPEYEDEREPFEHDPDLISDDDLFSLWCDGCDAFSVNGGSGFTNEQGDSIHFYIDEWLTGYERNPQRAYNYGDHAGETFAERIATLATICRVHDEDPALVLVAKDAWLEDPNSDETIKLLNQIAPDYRAAILYAWECERSKHTAAQKEES